MGKTGAAWLAGLVLAAFSLVADTTHAGMQSSLIVGLMKLSPVLVI